MVISYVSFLREEEIDEKQWSGNASATEKDGKMIPFVFDPSSYYGHNEAEFGIMQMFGGTSSFFCELNQKEIQASVRRPSGKNITS